MSNQVGLQNQGATCYLNSLIQQLRFIPEFKAQLYSLKKEQIFDNNNTIKAGKHIPYEMTQLIAKMDSMQKEGNKRSASTESLTNAFGWNELQLAQQHDINDAWNILMDGINTSMPHDKKFYPKYFTGKIANIRECDDCKCITTNKEHFTQLNIPVVEKIVQGIPVTFENVYKPLISLYLNKETLYGKNKVLCLECEVKVRADQISRIVSLPIILVLNLNQYVISDGIQFKLNETLKCPLSLDLSMFIDHEHSEMAENIIKEYNLNGVVCHSGGTDSGHYISYTRQLTPLDDEKQIDAIQWLKFNDKQEVTTHSDKDIEQLFVGNNEFTPYMAIYRRKYMNDISPEIPKYIQNAIQFNSHTTNDSK
eukprot:26653_1